jgi:hypothetical protein
MRQTSRAVALLLALDSAQATTIAVASNVKNGINRVMYPSIMIPLGGADNNLMGAISSRTAPYNSCSYGVTFAQWPAASAPNCPLTMVSGWTSGTPAPMTMSKAYPASALTASAA